MIDKSQVSILVVDDEEDIRDVLEIALMDIGYTVLLAENGEKAFEIFKSKRPQIVITDIKMPVMDGIELLRQIKRENPATEVLMITGHGDMDLTIRSLKHEAMDFITKPVNVDILEIAVEKAVEKIVSGQKLLEYTQKLELLILEKSKLADHLSGLGLMMGTISHNIKGLLTNLDGGLYVARSGLKNNNNKTIEEGMDLLGQSVDRIKKMIMDVLLYSKERKLNRTVIETKGFVSQIKKMMELKLKKTNIIFNCNYTHCPETMFVDEEFIMAALVNILDNAIDACRSDMQKKDHAIEFEILRKTDQLVIQIYDNGCGMDSQTKEKIFNLFFSSKSTKGTGFGLYISNSIIKQHGGFIHVTSIKEKETLFKIILPDEI
ncbi:hybrid sensor histidine kinase/response regulator [Desulfobacula phenolica]|uniref:histidine kinase n=1 Tax=Desulfobacula phenolica TaxID=90732 RepID=A0A1H2GG62_9BACT|nr:hybrid sensor histidine kinase/response regulator [Desulfobacula phenolica]SDU18401.1 Histidine kinase-, DNA gyrase B-, and HSP90-like ATPase [Desulfobacula phenolica]